MEQLKLNPEVKAAWVAALTSGEYKQTTARLRDGYGFCCLGVLCDIYKDQTGKGAWKDTSNNYGDEYPPPPEFEFLGADTAPPDEVLDWAFTNYVSRDSGNPDCHARDVVVNVPGEHDEDTRLISGTLAERNDGGTSFKDIAKIIDENL